MDLQTNKKAPWKAVLSTQGSASININITDKNLTHEQKESLITNVLTQVSLEMMRAGYIELLSMSDLAERYGKTRQYWEKLVKEGKILYKQTASGKITTNLWVEGYLNDKEYYKFLSKARTLIINHYKKTKNSSDNLACPKCSRPELYYHYNEGKHINALCSSCKLRVDTQE